MGHVGVFACFNPFNTNMFNLSANHYHCAKFGECFNVFLNMCFTSLIATDFSLMSVSIYEKHRLETY